MTAKQPAGNGPSGIPTVDAAAETASNGKLNLPHPEESRSVTRVEIFVAESCPICEYAYEVAGSIQEKFPAVDLRIVNLSQSAEPIPDAVFATPTYLLNGRLWSLGNPSSEDIQVRLSPTLKNATSNI